MKATVVHRCGHSAENDFPYVLNDLPEQVAERAALDCVDCFAEERRARRLAIAADLAAGKALAKELGVELREDPAAAREVGIVSLAQMLMDRGGNR